MLQLIESPEHHRYYKYDVDKPMFLSDTAINIDPTLMICQNCYYDCENRQNVCRTAMVSFLNFGLPQIQVHQREVVANTRTTQKWLSMEKFRLICFES
jgi:phosphotransacetylase